MVHLPMPARKPGCADHAPGRRQSGIALPVMLIILAVMLLGSIYLLKSSTSTTLTTSNLAYDAALTKAADLGVYKGYQWISTVDKSTLINNIPAAGYVATMAPEQRVSDGNFWNGSVTFTDNATPPNQIEYVIHRMCTFAGLYNSTAPANSCMKSMPMLTVASATPIGADLASDAPDLGPEPQLHYLITARIFGARGGNVMNQAVVLINP